jgi:hypothetical protein
VNVPDERITKDELFDKYMRFCKVAGLHVAKKKDEGSVKNNLGRFIHKNVDWLSKDLQKNEVERIGNGKESKPEAIWPDTKFDDDRFNEWVKSKNL